MEIYFMKIIKFRLSCILFLFFLSIFSTKYKNICKSLFFIKKKVDAMQRNESCCSGQVVLSEYSKYIKK